MIQFELILGACIFDFQVTAHNIKGNKTKDASWPAFKGEPNERLKLALKGRNVNIFSAAGCCSIKHLYKTFFCLEFELLSAQPCSFALEQQRTQKDFI